MKSWVNLEKNKKTFNLRKFSVNHKIGQEGESNYVNLETIPILQQHCIEYVHMSQYILSSSGLLQ